MKKTTYQAHQTEITAFGQIIQYIMDHDKAITLEKLKDTIFSLPDYEIIMECLEWGDVEWMINTMFHRLSPLRETKEWKKLFKELLNIQNNGKHDHHDIVSITGFFGSLEELERHVKRNRC